MVFYNVLLYIIEGSRIKKLYQYSVREITTSARRKQVTVYKLDVTVRSVETPQVTNKYKIHRKYALSSHKLDGSR